VEDMICGGDWDVNCYEKLFTTLQKQQSSCTKNDNKNSKPCGEE
jgi:hypothetical protein